MRIFLKIIRTILKIFTLFGTFVTHDMVYTIFAPDRYYIFKVDYIFLTVYFLCLVSIAVITHKLNDFYKDKYKKNHNFLLIVKLALLTIIIVMFTRFNILSNHNMISSEKYFLVRLGEYSIAERARDNFFVYVFILIDYFSIRKAILYMIALRKRLSKGDD